MATPENKMRMEELLHYFHVTCNPAVAVFENAEADMFRANLDVAAAEHFAHSKYDVVDDILAGTLKYYKALEKTNTDNKTGVSMPEPAHAWIDFEAALRKHEARVAIAEANAKKTAAVAAVPEAKIIEFDETTGVQLTKQDEQVIQRVDARRVLLPWTAWAGSDVTLREGAKQLCKNAALIAMRTLRGHIHIDADAVCIVQDTTGTNRRVVATSDIPPDTLELHVICSHKTILYDDTSNHSLRAKVTVERKTAKDSKV